MAKATGIGGIFLRSRDPEALYGWYEKHLGILRAPYGSFAFEGEEAQGTTVVAFFPLQTKHFGPGEKAVMLNFRVDDLDAVLKGLKESGAAVEDARDEADYGKFGWFTDPEGNRVELWQPPVNPASK
jgi:predicted enzyme related to lactoylglutathione lyase